jgi:hypothetical protein
MAGLKKDVDRTGWPAGEWDNEPDRLEWRSEMHGLSCLISRNGLGAWCGYVAVPPGHPWHELDYNTEVFHGVEVHGGLTYSDHCSGHICHVPAPGEPDDVWWLGFDCAHGCDYVPGMYAAGGIRARMGDIFLMSGEKYRNIQYVREQCEDLARQVREAEAALTPPSGSATFR